jgi:ankyrin repeat protein
VKTISQSESVILLLAVQQKDKFGYYPFHLACTYKQTESVIQLLINK